MAVFVFLFFGTTEPPSNEMLLCQSPSWPKQMCSGVRTPKSCYDTKNNIRASPHCSRAATSLEKKRPQDGRPEATRGLRLCPVSGHANEALVERCRLNQGWQNYQDS